MRCQGVYMNPRTLGVCRASCSQAFTSPRSSASALRLSYGTEMMVAEAGSTELAVAFPDEPLHAALAKMLNRDIGRLPVVERKNPTHVIGYLGRAALLSARMRLHEEEHIRQRS